MAREISNAIMGVILFLFPLLSIEAAIESGIVGNFGCWFWIDADGYRVCKRHTMRAIGTGL